ncbi:hypothetical protein [Candidatus Oleimmundimicrobium sp.]|uniref:hypothetical protein n=1 Tax=Candidatus Oleimmundimicrobium sp. TaxID=3060597 RepID=UPI002727FC40|nr:hypothetical protein [Candidatus Oleimmundimicrobium sp.]MDO8886341.1 hypothetical protein [Candidatus Oleimmundimicrobium sp.]
MDRTQYGTIVKMFCKPLVSKVEGIDNYFLRELWMTILDATERSLSGILFFSPTETSFDKDINKEDIQFWFKKVSLCFVSWIYYFYTMEQRRDLINKGYLYLQGDSCGGRILDVYESLFGVKPNTQEVIRYSLGLKEDEEKALTISGAYEMAMDSDLKDYQTIGSELLENIWHENIKDFKLKSGYGENWDFSSIDNPLAKKMFFIGARLWQAHQQIIQPFLMKNPIGKAPKWYRIVPISYGLGSIIIMALVFYFFGSNIITWIIGGILLFIAWSNLKIGLFGSKKLIDELTQDKGKSLTKEVDEESKKFLK